MNNIPTYKEFLNEEVPTEDMHVYEVTCRDPEGSLKKIIECIGECGNTGHGFDVIVDPEVSEGLAQRKFYWDGDGSDYLHSVKTIQTPVKESLTNHFLKNNDLQKLNKIMFSLYDSGKINKDEYSSIQTILKNLDKL
jgi:hypothetical protein